MKTHRRPLPSVIYLGGFTFSDEGFDRIFSMQLKNFASPRRSTGRHERRRRKASESGAALVDENLLSLNQTGSASLPAESHLRARALNRARLKLVADGIITRHLAAAFEIDGRG